MSKRIYSIYSKLFSIITDLLTNIYIYYIYIFNDPKDPDDFDDSNGSVFPGKLVPRSGGQESQFCQTGIPGVVRQTG
jgi:hypothetical protein